MPWSLTGSYSYVSDNFFKKLDGMADVALNASQHKIKAGTSYAFPQLDLQVSGRVRYADSFRMSTGVYIGKVDAHTVLDLNLVYGLPVPQDLVLKVDIGNVLDNVHQEFIGAPEVGRLVFAQLGASF